MLYKIIDRIPEMPYLVMAAAYSFMDSPQVVLRVLSVAFLYMATSLVLGVWVKCRLHTDRPRKYRCIPFARYDVPSLHTMLSVGAAAYSLHVEPLFSVFTFPLAAAYMHSRINLGFHTRKAVYVGAVLGALTGSIYGFLIWDIELKGLECLFTSLLFLVPALATLYRLRYLRLE